MSTSDIWRGSAPRALKQIDLKHQRGQALLLIEQILERRIGDDAAVPVIFALDLDRGEGGRKRARGHNMFWSDPLLIGIEIDKIAGPDIHRADANALAAIVQNVEINQAFESFL